MKDQKTSKAALPKFKTPWIYAGLVSVFAASLLTVLNFSAIVYQGYHYQVSLLQETADREIKSLESYMSEMRLSLQTLSRFEPGVGILRAMDNSGLDSLDGVPIERMKSRYAKLAQSFLEAYPILDKIELVAGSDQIVMRLIKKDKEVVVTDPSATFEVSDGEDLDEQWLEQVWQGALAGKTDTRFSEWSESVAKGYVSFAVPIFAESKPKGILVFSSRTQQLNARLSGLGSTAAATPAMAFLVDSEGMVLFQKPSGSFAWESGDPKALTEWLGPAKEDLSKVYSPWVRPDPTKPEYSLRAINVYSTEQLVWSQVVRAHQKALALLVLSFVVFLGFAFLLSAAMRFKNRKLLLLKTEASLLGDAQVRGQSVPVALVSPDTTLVTLPGAAVSTAPAAFDDRSVELLESLESLLNQPIESSKRRVELLQEVIHQAEVLSVNLTFESTAPTLDTQKIAFYSEKLRKLLDLSDRAVSDLSEKVELPEKKIIHLKELIQKKLHEKKNDKKAA